MLLPDFPKEPHQIIGKDNGRAVIQMDGSGARHLVDPVATERLEKLATGFPIEEIIEFDATLAEELARERTAHEATKAELGKANADLLQLRAELVDAGQKAEATLASVQDKAAAERHRLTAENATLAQKIAGLESAKSDAPEVAIDGIPAATMKKLAKAGFDSVESLKTADNDALLATGISAKDLMKVREATAA